MTDPPELPEVNENPFAAPDPYSGVPVVRGRMPAALRRDMLKHEATVRALGAVSLVYSAIMLFGTVLVMFKVEPLAPWKTLQYPLAAIPFGFGVLMFLSGAGLWLLQPWGRFLYLGIAAFPFCIFVAGVPGAIDIETRLDSESWESIWILMFSGFAIFVLASPDSGVVTARSYHRIIEQTPETGPPALLKTTVRVLLITAGLTAFYGFLLSRSMN